MNSEGYLAGLIDDDQVEGMSEANWRKLLLRYMINMETRVDALEKRSSWRNLVMTIPWALIGGLIGFLART